MDKKKKEELVGTLHKKFSSAGAVFLMEYSGVTVLNMTRLRKELHDASVDLHVVRNTLAKRALDGTKLESIKDQFVGPVAVAFSNKDAALAAKTLSAFAKDEENFNFKLGTLGEKVLSLDEIKNLAALPSREELLAKLVGTLNGVSTSLVGVLAAIPRQLLYTLRAIEGTKQ